MNNDNNNKNNTVLVCHPYVTRLWFYYKPKSGVVPLKKFTIQGLELLGNFILSKLFVTVHDSLVSEINISNFYCWTEWQISLAWIQATNQEFKTLLENRVNTLRKLAASKLRNYFKTHKNPTDIVTRSSKHDFIQNNL